MKYIKLYENRRDFVFDEQRYFPNTALVNGEDEPSYFTDVEEVVFELTVSLPTEKVVTGETYTLAVEYGGADVFSEATVTTTGDVTLNGTQFTANTDGDFSVTATYDGKTVTLNGTSKLMTAAPTIFESNTNNQYGQHYIHISKNGATKRATFNGVEYTSDEDNFSRLYYEELTAQTVVVTATAQETGKWESDTATATFNIPAAKSLTATISDDTLEDGQTAQLTVMYGSTNATSQAQITASGDVTCTSSGVVTAAYSTGSGSIVVRLNNLTPITINVTVAEAAQNIVFADNDVKSILANAFGSNGEITTAQAAAVTTWFEGGYNNTSTNPFCKNESVDSFDEFGTYFTSVTEIGEDAFQDCSNMQSITLPSSLTYIPDYTFSGCSSLESVTIPAAVTSIGNRVFDGCILLESITIPENVSSIGSRVFERCPNLTYISVDASNSYFNDGNGSNAIIDNNGNLVYGGRACTVIPNTVNSIGDNAFHSRYFGEHTLTIPSSVTAIGNYAFGGRLDIHPDYYLIMESTTPPTLGNGNDFGMGLIFVPGESLELYKAATNWSNHADHIRAYLTVSLSSESIVTGETYTLSVSYYGEDVLSNATITSTGDVTISGNSFTANSDGAFSITATYNGYTATLNGTAATPTPEPTPEYEYTTAVLDFSQMTNDDNFMGCVDEGNSWSFNGCKIYNGYLRIPNLGSFVGVQLGNLIDTPFEGCISYIKMTHTADNYKVNDSATYGEGVFTCDVDYDTTTHTTTFSNFVSVNQESPFDGMNFMLLNNATTQIRVTRIEVCYATAEVAPTPEPEYAVAVIDCSELSDAEPLESFDFSGTDTNLNFSYSGICTFDGEVSSLVDGVITIPTDGNFSGISIDQSADAMENSKVIDYIKLTHPSAEYKLNADTEVGNGLEYTCDVSFDSTTLTTTFSNFVSLNEYTFEGSNLQLFNGGSTDIKITRIEVAFLPYEEEE